jgi:hypothetical protein
MPFDTDIDLEIEARRKFGAAFRQENRELSLEDDALLRQYSLAFNAANSARTTDAKLNCRP